MPTDPKPRPKRVRKPKAARPLRIPPGPPPAPSPNGTARPPAPAPAPLPSPATQGEQPPGMTGGAAAILNQQVRGRAVFSRMIASPIEWLVPGLIPRDDLVLLVGDSGTGKTTFYAAVAAQATGGPLIGQSERRPAGRVLIYAPEVRSEGAMLGRLVVAGADLERVEDGTRYPDLSPRPLPHVPDRIMDLARAVEDAQASLLIIDPLPSLLSPGVSPGDGQGIRSTLLLLMELARRCSCAIIAVAHYRKSRMGNPLDWVSGHKEWTNTPRHVVAMGYDPRDDNKRVILSCKCSDAAGAAASRFDLDVRDGWPLFRLGDPVNVRARDISGSADSDADRDARGEAISFLRELLTEGEQRQKEIWERARGLGIKEHTLRRAKTDLGVSSEHRGVAPDRHLVWVRPAEWPDLSR